MNAGGWLAIVGLLCDLGLAVGIALYRRDARLAYDARDAALRERDEVQRVAVRLEARRSAELSAARADADRQAALLREVLSTHPDLARAYLDRDGVPSQVSDRPTPRLAPDGGKRSDS